ncbi:MAG: homocysteine S-methyltransferase family protein [Clostridia bacterium]|nr:homocysteine S-methyltransferase family protein [Clostridia bacterium]
MLDLGGRIIFFDGGMGTQLQAAGLKPGEEPERWNLLHPEIVQDVHARYLAAGCDVVTTNTFGANALRLGDDTGDIIRAAVEIARRACAAAGRGMVALDLGPTGKLLAPMGDLPFEEAVSLYRQAAQAGADADMVIIETMNDPYEMKAAVLGAKEGCDLPILATMTSGGDGRLLTGGTVEAMAVMLDGLGVTALGLNCGLGGEQMLPLVTRLRRVTDKPILVQPNAGLPTLMEGKTVFPASPEEFAVHLRALAETGAWLLGGCCGTTPAHIRAAKAAVGDFAPLPLPEITGMWIASGAGAVDMAARPVIVGERINPTGKKAMKEALRQGDMNWLMKEALRQQEAGAHALDVNVGLPGLDEADWMRRAVSAVQSVSVLPLQIDSADPAAIEAGLRTVCGKALVNSVSGRQDVLDAVLPVVKKYGGCVVGLLLDEDGIPETAEGRMAIARRIVAACDAAGIRRRDILLDALTMTVSTGADNARITLECVRRIRQELGMGTILGVSNISFGLPARPRLTAAFLTAAMEAGLDAAIANPLSEECMDAYCCALALTGRDAGCTEYVARFGGAAAKPAAVQEMTLESAVYAGLEQDAREAAAKLLAAGEAPLAVVETKMLPALTRVGDDYERGRMFLPQLVMAAQAAQGAFAVLEKAMAASGEQRASAGKIALATVEGDVHDIGKNIVRVLLSSYGFEVIDLGRNVKPEEVLAAVRAHDLRMVGLSALMTTTVPAMTRTIALLKQEAPEVKIIAGGAVLTAEMAAQIGADFYAPDAMATVRYALG